MEYLKKTNGIDLRARGTALQGHVKIQLKDDTTGRIVEEVEHKNFFTKALDSAYNGCPFGLDSRMKIGQGVAADDNTPDRIRSVYQDLLGGIICFPESLGDSVDDYYPSFADNYPTAYASQAEYQITDARQGNYDGVSSGKTSNGYRFVYNWGSTGGNGRISSVALSHRNCFTYFNDASEMFFPKRSTDNSVRGYFGTIHDQNSRQPLCITDRGVLIASLGDWCRAEYFKIPPYNVPLTEPLTFFNDRATPVWSMDIESEARTVPSWQYYEGFFWCIERTAGSSQTIIRKYKEEDGTLDRYTITWNAPQMCDSNSVFAIKDGYLYAGATVDGKIYKCSLTNAVDVTEIECNSVARENINTCEYTDTIYGRNFTINNGVLTNNRGVNHNVGNSANNAANQIVYQNGVWVVTRSPASTNLFSAQILGTYCATKANLDSPVEKTAEKQMVITYNVNQI